MDTSSNSSLPANKFRLLSQRQRTLAVKTSLVHMKDIHAEYISESLRFLRTLLLFHGF